MKIISTVSHLRNGLKKAALRPVGLVPTMGALHEGHLSLVDRAMKKCPLVVTTIYVNPTQFNNKEDLEKYPRTPGDDLKLLENHLRRDDIVFIPSDNEIYPSEDRRRFRFGNLDNVMEALHRPGHFNGVAQVVSRLFEITDPDVAFFGLKDFQQVAVIRSMVRQMKLRVRITGCPIIREPDGLAMSSRNRLLEPEIRQRAPVIYNTLSQAAGMFPGTEINEIRKFVTAQIEKEEGFRVEYFEIADDRELVPVNSISDIRKSKRYVGFIAVKAGRIRLIDNIGFSMMR
jgi:pantoate--beta-alanine ligase